MISKTLLEDYICSSLKFLLLKTFLCNRPLKFCGPHGPIPVELKVHLGEECRWSGGSPCRELAADAGTHLHAVEWTKVNIMINNNNIIITPEIVSPLANIIGKCVEAQSVKSENCFFLKEKTTNFTGK